MQLFTFYHEDLRGFVEPFRTESDTAILAIPDIFDKYDETAVDTIRTIRKEDRWRTV